MEKSIYIFSSGALSRRGNTIAFERELGTRYIPVETIREILVFGEVDINKRFLELLSQQEILLHYFNYHSYYMGTFYPREHYNSGYMILCQAQHYMESEKRLTLAKAFVKGAAGNIQRVLAYYKNRGKSVNTALDNIGQLVATVEKQSQVDQLMAIEGNIREQYYSAFDSILENTDFMFEKRSRRPPENRLNALISFGNTIMYTTILSEIYKTHLDPRIGYLHTTNYRRFSLNLDVAEIFKPIIVDRVIFSLVANRSIQKDDFDHDKGGLILKDSARERFVKAFDDKLKSTIKHRKLGRHVLYRRLIRLELYKIEKHLMGEEEYQPFLALW
ncbi:MAG: type I-B CRISPR-associated endonuclease Cas1 [Firmicutes bacterium]|nr:type I-B CRISPR-associated endonuclease Cas1 [Bacillota bacterium]